MKKYLQHILMCGILLFGFSAIAQQKSSYKPQYERARKAQKAEADIQDFISNNIHRYNVSPQRSQKIIKSASRFKATKQQHQALLTAIKKNELRKLYFHENPETEKFFTFSIDSIPTESVEVDTLRYICSNGGLEEGYTDEYVFMAGTYTDSLYNCNLDLNFLIPATPSDTLNNSASLVTLVDNDMSVANGNDQILTTSSVNVSRVNSGNMAIKLNDDKSGFNTASSMLKKFVVSSDAISFSYSFIAQDPGGPISERPHFTVRVFNGSSVVNEFCIYADQYNTALFQSTDYGPDIAVPLVYTGWQCHEMSLEGIPYGTELLLAFDVVDAFDPAYYGTVYIDDICSTDGTCKPAIGSVMLNINDINCKTLPLQVCGDYQLPQSTNTIPVLTGTLDGIVLNIYKANGTLVHTETTTTNLTSNFFCFQIDESDLGTPLELEYEFEVVATYTLGGYTYTITDLSSNFDFDLNFANCYDDCPDHVVVTADVTTGTDQQEANVSVTADNEIAATATALYHATETVLLLDGFLAADGSTGRFYLEGCTHDFVARQPVATPFKKGGTRTIDLVEVQNPVSYNRVYPNPASDRLNVQSSGSITSVRLVSLDGKIVIEEKAGGNSHSLNISTVKSGLYLLITENANGEVSSHKVIKK